MANESVKIDDTVLIQFNKIRLVNNIADSIADYGVQCGFTNLFELVDLNCGAVPDGNLEQVIDLSAPEQFLSLYTHVADSRLAYTVTQVLKISDNCWQPILNFCHQVGKNNQLGEIKTAENAFYVYQLFVLDGMPGEKTLEFVEHNENTVVWRKVTDTHEAYWKKFDGDVNHYYEILMAFIEGLLENTDIRFKIKDNSEFSLEKISM